MRRVKKGIKSADKRALQEQSLLAKLATRCIKHAASSFFASKLRSYRIQAVSRGDGRGSS